MIYKKFQDVNLSALGLGAMRLPTLDDKDISKIDEEKTAQMVAYAFENGINYFDTAYGYHDGMSEVVMGKILKNYPRESFFLADKFPGYDLANMDKIEEIFEEQLNRTGLEYFDFYLFHNVCELNVEQYIDEKYGIMDYMLAQKAKGRIKHIGFSAHGRIDTMKKFLEAYGDKMEFCQIQLNYLDWKLQEAKEKVDLLNEYNIPIWVMEPLRGGKLVNLSQENSDKIKAACPDDTNASVAFRFLQGVEGVTVTLSGMSDMQQLEQNIKTFSEEQPLDENELAAVMCVADSMLEILPCTACRYCITHRSCKLDIPNLLFMYNELKFSNGFITQMGIGAIPEDERPSACVGCRACEQVCPQQIKISEVMADFVDRMNQPASW